MKRCLAVSIESKVCKHCCTYCNRECKRRGLNSPDRCGLLLESQKNSERIQTLLGKRGTAIMVIKKEKASAAATTEAGCKASKETKNSITHQKKKSKGKGIRKCKISKCQGKLCCADCTVGKCQRRCLNSPCKCGLVIMEEGAAK